MDWWQWLILFALVFVISYMLATLLDNRRERVERAAVAGAGLMLTGAGEEFDDQLDFAREIYRDDFPPV